MKIKLPSLVLAFTVAFASAASAQVSIESIGTDLKSDTVTVKGTTDANDENLIVTVNSNGVSDSEFFDKLAYQNQIKTNADGSFEIAFKMKGADVFTVTASLAEEETAKNFVYADSESTRNAIERLNASADTQKCIKDDRYALGLYLNGVDAEPSFSSLASRVKKLIPLNADDVNDSVLKLQRELIYQYIGEGKIANVFDYDKYLDIFSISGNDVFTAERFKDSHKKEASALISGKTISDYNDFADKITEAMILALVKDANGFGNVKAVLEAHAAFIGIDTSNTPDSVYKNLCNQTFADLAALRAKFNSLKADANDKGGSGSGSGGGKTGGGGGNSGKLTGGNVDYSSDNTAAKSAFSDLSGYEWAKQSIETLASKGIVAGLGDGRFLPAKSVTRSEFVKMLTLALGIIGGDDSGINFTDVSDSNWDAPFIKAAYAAGIVSGISETNFGGGYNISRQDMAVMIKRALVYAGRSAANNGAAAFADDSAIADYAKDAVYTLRSTGVMQGDENGNFNPTAAANRAEAAKVICSLLK